MAPVRTTRRVPECRWLSFLASRLLGVWWGSQLSFKARLPWDIIMEAFCKAYPPRDLLLVTTSLLLFPSNPGSSVFPLFGGLSGTGSRPGVPGGDRASAAGGSPFLGFGLRVPFLTVPAHQPACLHVFFLSVQLLSFCTHHLARWERARKLREAHRRQKEEEVRPVIGNADFCGTSVCHSTRP